MLAGATCFGGVHRSLVLCKRGGVVETTKRRDGTDGQRPMELSLGTLGTFKASLQRHNFNADSNECRLWTGCLEPLKRFFFSALNWYCTCNASNRRRKSNYQPTTQHGTFR